MSATILVVDDAEPARTNISSFLTSEGYEVIGAATFRDARMYLEQGRADIILLDLELPDGYGPDLLDETAQMPMRPPVIIITAYGNIEKAVDAMKSGAHDFFEKPIQFGPLIKSIERAKEIIAMRRELAHMRSVQFEQLDFVIGKSPAMKRLLDQAQRAATTQVSVLITGETGTGKEILARAIHSMGSQRERGNISRPFIAINCAAIQSTVLESELFGHEAGAFTSAEKRKNGLIEIADGGILFLDEISSMPVDVQAKLLRVLEEHAFRRVGGTNLIKVDLQILAASNRDLHALMADSKFREDLYYRLKVVDLHIPPLRERKEDIPDLVGYFIRENNLRMGMNITDVTPQALELLMDYSWPGNIRQLRNAIERAMLFCDETKIDTPHLPPELGKKAS